MSRLHHKEYVRPLYEAAVNPARSIALSTVGIGKMLPANRFTSKPSSVPFSGRTHLDPQLGTPTGYSPVARRGQHFCEEKRDARDLKLVLVKKS